MIGVSIIILPPVITGLGISILGFTGLSIIFILVCLRFSIIFSKSFISCLLLICCLNIYLGLSIVIFIFCFNLFLFFNNCINRFFDIPNCFSKLIISSNKVYNCSTSCVYNCGVNKVDSLKPIK